MNIKTQTRAAAWVASSNNNKNNNNNILYNILYSLRAQSRAVSGRAEVWVGDGLGGRTFRKILLKKKK